MQDLKAEPSPVALIGDIVASRAHRHRQALHDAFAAAVERANDEVPVDDPAVITVGDEFQGVYPSLGEALRASFVVRAALFPRADIRFGLGRGAVSTLDPVRGIHDGPAYWAAREAITLAEDRAQRAQTRTSRTAYLAPDEPADTVAVVRAALDCLDFMVGSMSNTSREILGALMNGHAQHDIAEQVGISPSAVSQRVRRDGIGVALEAMTTLGELP